MNTTYLAIVTQSAEGPYVIEFPDLPGAYAQASSFADIEPEARQSLVSYLYTTRTEQLDIAPPSQTLSVADGQTALLVTVDVEQYARMQDNRTVKKTVSLPAWLAESADSAGLSLSKVLQDSLKTRLRID